MFKMYISNLTLCSATILEIVLTKRNKLNDFKISRGSYVKYKSGFSFEAGVRTFRPVVSYSVSGTLKPIFESIFIFLLFNK